MADDFEIQDGSNDKAYFTMVPNIVLNHSSAVDQALYMQMKRFAGERRGGGLCYASERTLMKQLKIGTKALKESLAYLQEHGWVSFSGERTVSTEGGFQKVKSYHVNDIWKMNINHYKGASESVPLHEGASESSQGAFRRRQGASESTPIYNNRTTRTLSADEPREVRVPSEEIQKPRASPKYPHSKEVFALWPSAPRNWSTNSTQLIAAENLYEEQGVEEIKAALEYIDKHKSEDFFPQIATPHDLDSKWTKLSAFYDKKHA